MACFWGLDFKNTYSPGISRNKTLALALVPDENIGRVPPGRPGYRPWPTRGICLWRIGYFHWVHLLPGTSTLSFYCATPLALGDGLVWGQEIRALYTPRTVGPAWFLRATFP